MDGRPYGAYRTLVGTYALDEFEIVIDHVAIDPAAGPASVRLRAKAGVVGLPARWIADPSSRLAIEDLVVRSAARAVIASGLLREGAPPGSGSVLVEPPGEAIVERGGCRVADGVVELRLLVDLPAQRRTVRGLAAEDLLTVALVRLAKSTLLFGPTRVAEAEAHVAAVRSHRALQRELEGRGLVAFFADGAVPQLPSSLSVTLNGDGGPVRGAAIPAGVTLIAGGALQGKSALLTAIASGVHPHPPRHPRAGIVTARGAAIVRAERGRNLVDADLSLFMRATPAGPDPAALTCRPAPRALAQAAAAAEAIAAGATLLLVDEDDSAPAFLTRDARMQRLVPTSDSGLMPLVDRARDLYDALGVSTIVASSSIGEFLGTAHTTLVVRGGRVEDATERGGGIAAASRAARSEEPRPPAFKPEPLMAAPRELPAARGARVALHGRDGVRVGDAIVDLGAIATLVEPGQRRALGAILSRVSTLTARPTPLAELLDAIESEIDAHGLEVLTPTSAPGIARPRRVEIAAALVRGVPFAPRDRNG